LPETSKTKPNSESMGSIPAGSTTKSTSGYIEPLTVRPRTAAAAIGVGHNKLWELIRDGQLNVSRIGRVTSVHVDSIRELIARTTAN
jgi:hypothetical protein